MPNKIKDIKMIGPKEDTTFIRFLLDSGIHLNTNVGLTSPIKNIVIDTINNTKKKSPIFLLLIAVLIDKQI